MSISGEKKKDDTVGGIKCNQTRDHRGADNANDTDEMVCMGRAMMTVGMGDACSCQLKQ